MDIQKFFAKKTKEKYTKSYLIFLLQTNFLTALFWMDEKKSCPVALLAKISPYPVVSQGEKGHGPVVSATKKSHDPVFP